MIHNVQVLAANQATNHLQLLEAIAEQIFGRKNRPKGWFQRKLIREQVDGHLSVIARFPAEAQQANPSAGICGYMLLGRPHESSQIAYGAGMGVVPQVQGLGIGKLLVEQAKNQVIAAGLCSMEVLATHKVQPFYQRLGFIEIEPRATLFASARGDIQHRDGVCFHSPLSWDPESQADIDSYLQVCGWHAHTWHATPINQKLTLSIAFAQNHAPAWIHISREGNAFLVQRLLIPPLGSDYSLSQALLAIVNRLLATLPYGQACLLYGCRTRDVSIKTLLEHDWHAVQKFSLMRWEQRSL